MQYWWYNKSWLITVYHGLLYIRIGHGAQFLPRQTFSSIEINHQNRSTEEHPQKHRTLGTIPDIQENKDRSGITPLLLLKLYEGRLVWEALHICFNWTPSNIGHDGWKPFLYAYFYCSLCDNNDLTMLSL